MNIRDISDEGLMLKAQEGELDAIGILYQRYSKRLYNFFLRLTSNRDTSSELTQNVFYRVLKYKKSFDPEHLFKTWMYQMARNCLNDHRVMSSKHQRLVDTEKVLSSILDDESASHQAIQDALLFRAIDNLPFESKELIVMSKFQGLKYEEISKITGDSVPNIKIKVHRTMIKLKELYFEMEKA
jgi:RNA polymerase sigma factor (sigma-70 family)